MSRTGTLLRGMRSGGTVRGSEHVSIAVLTTGGVMWLATGHIDLSAAAIAGVGAAAVGALVPDIDHPRAWISSLIPFTLLTLGGFALGAHWFMRHSVQRDESQMFAPLMDSMADALQPLLGLMWAAVAAGGVLLGISIALLRFVDHRGPTHSLTVAVGVTLFATIAFALPGYPSVGLWFGWGYLSHLLADLITPMGCPALLWPWSTEGAADSSRGDGDHAGVPAESMAASRQREGIADGAGDAAGKEVPFRK